MSERMYTAKAYLLLNCPFSFKFLLFMTEAGLRDQIEIVCFDVNSDDHEEMKSRLEKSTGERASFPTVEIKPGVYMADSDALINYYTNKNMIENMKLPTLAFYKNGVYKEIIRLFRENNDLKSQLS